MVARTEVVLDWLTTPVSARRARLVTRHPGNGCDQREEPHDRRAEADQQDEEGDDDADHVGARTGGGLGDLAAEVDGDPGRLGRPPRGEQGGLGVRGHVGHRHRVGHDGKGDPPVLWRPCRPGTGR